MHRKRSAKPQVAKQMERGVPPSNRCREIGLAAVAAALDLPIDALDPETAAAVERGALALAAPRSMLAA
jgi:hypothetical protein